mmetsp:Transcript_108236/g.345680  ORF Transcript_108236/g.345680 Transcript_108236/m.345680 type:complete len:388 (-) Transcript_108236:81-1244(-)
MSASRGDGGRSPATLSDICLVRLAAVCLAGGNPELEFLPEPLARELLKAIVRQQAAPAHRRHEAWGLLLRCRPPPRLRLPPEVDGVRVLLALPGTVWGSLREIALGPVQGLSDAVLAAGLVQAPRLASLRLTGCLELTGHFVEALRGSTSLETLVCRGCVGLRPAALVGAAGLPLRRLGMAGAPHISDEAVAQLCIAAAAEGPADEAKTVMQLSFLDLSGSAITDDVIDYLCLLPQAPLEALLLSRTPGVSHGSLMRLSKALRLRLGLLPDRPKVLVRSHTVAAKLHILEHGDGAAASRSALPSTGPPPPLTLAVARETLAALATVEVDACDDEAVLREAVAVLFCEGFGGAGRVPGAHARRGGAEVHDWRGAAEGPVPPRKLPRWR